MSPKRKVLPKSTQIGKSYWLCINGIISITSLIFIEQNKPFVSLLNFSAGFPHYQNQKAMPQAFTFLVTNIKVRRALLAVFVTLNLLFFLKRKMKEHISTLDTLGFFFLLIIGVLRK